MKWHGTSPSAQVGTSTMGLERKYERFMCEATCPLVVTNGRVDTYMNWPAVNVKRNVARKCVAVVVVTLSTLVALEPTPTRLSLASLPVTLSLLTAIPRVSCVG